MIRLAVCVALGALGALVVVVLFGAVLVAMTPFPDEHDGVED